MCYTGNETPELKEILTNSKQVIEDSKISEVEVCKVARREKRMSIGWNGNVV